MSFWDSWIETIQPTKKSWAIVLLIINVFLPGVGTIINSMLGQGITYTGIMIGALQMLLSVGIIGWLWSIYWGVLMYERSGPAGTYAMPPKREKTK